jgi:hypothetical protein
MAKQEKKQEKPSKGFIDRMSDSGFSVVQPSKDKSRRLEGKITISNH